MLYGDGFKVSAFNYLFVGYDLGFADNVVMQRIACQGDVVAIKSENLSYYRAHNLAVGFSGAI